ncbi:DUF3151 domain-containing protein [Streptomyces sp. NPDC002920]
MSIHENLLGGPPPTHLPDDPEPREALANGTAPADVAAKHPTSSLAWAQLADDAFARGSVVESYAYARTGYHRGLDSLRRGGWKGHGPVPWEHEPNRGFLRALHALARAAQAIGEQEEYERFADGLAQETCRDFGHTGWGIASIADIAETSRIQGQDLYPKIQERLRYTLGFHTSYENGTAVPSWLCGGSIKTGLARTTEVGYNALHNRLGISMSNTQKYTEAHRPSGTDNYFNAWTTLTHADNPN